MSSRAWWNGRHKRLKIARAWPVRVRLPPPAPMKFIKCSYFITLCAFDIFSSTPNRGRGGFHGTFLDNAVSRYSSTDEPTKPLCAGWLAKGRDMKKAVTCASHIGDGTASRDNALITGNVDKPGNSYPSPDLSLECQIPIGKLAGTTEASHRDLADHLSGRQQSQEGHRPSSAYCPAILRCPSRRLHSSH